MTVYNLNIKIMLMAKGNGEFYVRENEVNYCNTVKH